MPPFHRLVHQHKRPIVRSNVVVQEKYLLAELSSDPRGLKIIASLDKIHVWMVAVFGFVRSALYLVAIDQDYPASIYRP